MEKLRFIISGGGTGGHIFPAISIANALRQECPGAEILFVGAEGRMEMTRVPQAGYQIVGLPIRGFYRPLWKPANLGVLCDFFRSKRMAKACIRRFGPHVAVGVGGYASSATLNAAHEMNIPCLIQEQNSYAGLANKTMARKAQLFCVAYRGMERFFPADRIQLTGNPVRQDLLDVSFSTEECRHSFGLKPHVPTLLVVGGSLGARTINECILHSYSALAKAPLQVIWQTGGGYYARIMEALNTLPKAENIVVTDFVSHMDRAYRAASLVISRAGASTISELCLLGKASILVPSPNVAEDHQTKNAQALAAEHAALMVADAQAPKLLVQTAMNALQDSHLLQSLSDGAKKMAFVNSAKQIARAAIRLAEDNIKKTKK